MPGDYSNAFARLCYVFLLTFAAGTGIGCALESLCLELVIGVFPTGKRPVAM